MTDTAYTDYIIKTKYTRNITIRARTKLTVIKIYKKTIFFPNLSYWVRSSESMSFDGSRNVFINIDEITFRIKFGYTGIPDWPLS